MKNFLTASVIAIILISTLLSLIPASANVVRPDTWEMIDGLDRVVSTNEEVGNKKNNKTVGVFYWPWHMTFASENTANNLTEILAKYPDAVNNYNHKAWTEYSSNYYFWDKPIFGYYSTNDVYVIRKQAELLADAGVDVIFMDCSNGAFLWENSVDIIYRVFTQAKNDGINVPKISYLLNFAGGESTKQQLITLYNKIYAPGKYQDLWFYWEGKPMIMARPSCIASYPEIANFFTLRGPEAGYAFGDTTYEDMRWGWLCTYPQARFGVDSKGNVEQMAVGVAQNWNHEGLVAMNDPDGNVRGRSYTYGNFSYTYVKNGKEVTVNKNITNSEFYGLNFQQQWDYAIANNPQMIFVTGWNEWVAMRQQRWQGTNNAFGDQFSVEYSRDIEPSEGILKDYYYTQLVENIRRYKGASKNPDYYAEATIDITSSDDMWAGILPEYTHYSNLKYGKRSGRGYKGNSYISTDADKSRNDIVSAKVAYDDNNIYFMAETVKEISPYTDTKWMRLFIDTAPETSEKTWEGFEYMVNRKGSDRTETKTTLEKSNGGWNFTSVGQIDYAVSGNRIQITIPRSYLGLEGKEFPRFNFKWSDNNIDEEQGDIMDVYTDGDSAPGSRFTFAFNPEATSDIEKLTLTGYNSKLSLSDGFLLGLAERRSNTEAASEFYKSKDIVFSKGCVGTGDEVSLVLEGKTKDTAIVIVKGDVNGDGRVTTADYILVKKSISDTRLLSKYGKMAADTDDNGNVAAADYARIKKHFNAQLSLYA